MDVICVSTPTICTVIRQKVFHDSILYNFVLGLFFKQFYQFRSNQTCKILGVCGVFIGGDFCLLHVLTFQKSVHLTELVCRAVARVWDRGDKIWIQGPIVRPRLVNSSIIVPFYIVNWMIHALIIINYFPVKDLCSEKKKNGKKCISGDF